MRPRVGLRKLKARALRSRKFRRWRRGIVHHKTGRRFAFKERRVFIDAKTDNREHEATERHFTPAELGNIWGLSAETIRGLFEKESGVLVVATTAKGKRRYRTFRIPERVVIRVHNSLSPP
jgi:hypothetical protein